MKKQTTALLWAAFPAAAQAQGGGLSLLNLPKAGSAEASLAIMFVFALCVAAVVFEIVKLRYERSLYHIVSEGRFLQNSARFELDPEERRVMHALGRQCLPLDVNELFYSLSLFERGIQAEAAEVLASCDDEEELERVEALFESVRKKLHYNAVEQGMPITSTRNISTGQPVWILSPRKTVVAEGMVIRMREFSFAVKLSDGGTARHPSFDSAVRLAFARRADGIYGAEAPFVSFDRQSGIVTCRHTLGLQRNQMRSDVRVETDFSISIRRLVAAGGDESVVRPFMVRVVDLSGGGFAFITDQELTVNSEIIVCASAPKVGMEGVRAMIVAFSQHYGSSRTMYHARFLDIEFPKKERIVKYVFARLRDLNQR